MLDIKKILLDNGVTEEVADICTTTIEKEFPKNFVSKAQYKKKTEEIDTLNGKIADLEIKAENINTDEYKIKFEEIEKQFNDYKIGIETKETNKIKNDTILNQLKKEGANEGVLDLLLKAFDLEKINVKDNSIEDWDNIVQPVKEKYSGCFGTTTTVGNAPMTPPITNTEIDNKPKSLAEALKFKYNE